MKAANGSFGFAFGQNELQREFTITKVREPPAMGTLQVGDVLLSVNGHTCAQLRHEDVVNIVRPSMILEIVVRRSDGHGGDRYPHPYDGMSTANIPPFSAITDEETFGESGRVSNGWNAEDYELSDEVEEKEKEIKLAEEGLGGKSISSYDHKYTRNYQDTTSGDTSALQVYSTRTRDEKRGSSQRLGIRESSVMKSLQIAPHPRDDSKSAKQTPISVRAVASTRISLVSSKRKRRCKEREDRHYMTL